MPLFHTNSHGPDQATLHRALVFGCSRRSDSPDNTVVVLAHTVQSFRQGSFNDVLGRDAITSITNGTGSFAGCRILLGTERRPQVAHVFLAAHISPTWLSRIIRDNPDAVIVYLPWMADELAVYVQQHPESAEI